MITQPASPPVEQPHAIRVWLLPEEIARLPALTRIRVCTESVPAASAVRELQTTHRLDLPAIAARLRRIAGEVSRSPLLSSEARSLQVIAEQLEGGQP